MLSTRHIAHAALAGQQFAHIIVQPSASVVACIHDGSILLAVLVAEKGAVQLMETLAVHRFDVHVGQLAA